MHARFREPSCDYLGVAAALLVTLAAGCGGVEERDDVQLVPVTGLVTLNGQPLKDGTISFVAVNGPNNATGQITEGEYTLGTFASKDGVPPGEYRVSVTAWKEPPQMGKEAIPAVPQKYLDATRSGLTATVTDEPEQTIDFELKTGA